MTVVRFPKYGPVEGTQAFPAPDADHRYAIALRSRQFDLEFFWFQTEDDRDLALKMLAWQTMDFVILDVLADVPKEMLEAWGIET